MRNLILQQKSGELKTENIQALNGTIKSNVGDITLNNTLTTKKLEVLTKSSDIDGKNITAQNLDIATNTGDISAKTITSDTLNLNTEDGDIDITINDKRENYLSMIISENGDVEISPLYLDTVTPLPPKTIQAISKCGDITVKYLKKHIIK